MSDAELSQDVARRVQEIFRSNPALLVGSGFSCAYDLPPMGSLGDHLLSALGPNLTTPEARDLWASAQTAIRADLEQGLNSIPAAAAGRSEVIQVLRELTAELIIRRTVEAEAKILNHASPELHAPVRLLRRLYNGVAQNASCIQVITTNYDTLIELFCDIAGLPLDTGFEGFRRRRFRENDLFQPYFSRSLITDAKRGSRYEYREKTVVRLMKPHGSITWIKTDLGPIEVINDLSNAPRAIVVPGPTKYEDALVNTLFDKVRSEMNLALSRTGALVSIGFGFNDEHLQGVVRMRIASGMPAIIIARNLTNAAKLIVEEHPNVIAITARGGGAECQFSGIRWRCAEPLWQLDTFLSHFLE